VGGKRDQGYVTVRRGKRGVGTLKKGSNQNSWKKGYLERNRGRVVKKPSRGGKTEGRWGRSFGEGVVERTTTGKTGTKNLLKQKK